jgi:hypothetical protein
MATYPTSPREDFMTWCRDHVKPFTTNPTSVGLTPAQAQAFSETYGEALAAINTQSEARLAAETATQTANERVATMKRVASSTVKLIRAFATASTNPDAVYTAAQIPAPDAPSPVPPPGQPNMITVGIQPGSGAITLKWKCENPRGASGTSYVVRRMIGNTGRFEFVGVTGKKSFVDTTFAAGPDSVQYTVQAQRSDRSGPTSEPVIVNFGSMSSPVPGRITMGESFRSMKMAA